jgi:hypothetical protein
MKLRRKFIWPLVIAAVFSIWSLDNFRKYPIIPVYDYESSDRGMSSTEYPTKGVPLSEVEREFEKYKRTKADPSLRLCRTFEHDWWNFLRWHDYLTHPRWRLPYMTPSLSPPASIKAD